jgi:hypothetical protein
MAISNPRIDLSGDVQMNAIKHATQQPFIFATGLAALIHSTWSLGTLFAGNAPAMGSWEWWGWIIPAFLIAFAMDVGQISTSAQIRDKGMNFSRGVTFMVFAFATYYLQWLYIAHHMPALALAEGISDIHRPFALALRDAGMWIIPALLPLSTLLYTFSSDHKAQATAPKQEAQPAVVIVDSQSSAILPPNDAITPHLPPSNAETMAEEWEPLARPQEPFVAKCEHCDWEREYTSEAARNRGLNMHRKNNHSAELVGSNGNLR